MYSNQKLVKAILGDKVFEALNKSIVKLNTKSVVDISELHSALKIAPKSVIAFLMKHLSPMEKDEAKEIHLPWDDNASMLINKKDADVFMGHISKDGKIIHEYDLCSIPQLAAHILSLFELYDESPSQMEESHKEPVQEQSNSELESIKTKVALIESKINALIMLSVNAPAMIQKSQKTELQKAIKALKQVELKKAGLAPGMPKPPRPGVHSGSQQGISQSGMHGAKTAHSDLNPAGGQSQTRLSPNLKSGASLSAKNGLPAQPKQIKEAKMSMTLKSESTNSKCLDCGEPDFIGGKFQKCSCFKAMSNPDVKKSDSGTITMIFQSDWDIDNRVALWHSLRKVRE